MTCQRAWVNCRHHVLIHLRLPPNEPVHTFLVSQPLNPGKVVPLEIPLGPILAPVPQGDSLRLLVAGRQLAPRTSLMGSFPASYVFSTRANCTLHWGSDMPAALRVPIIPRKE